MPLPTTSQGQTVITTETTKQHVAWLEAMGAVVALTVMAVYAFTVIAPYLLRPTLDPDILDVIKSNKSTVDLITTAVVMFYFGASVGRRKDQETTGHLAQANAIQAAALAPETADAIPVAAGETRTIVGQEHTP